MSKLSDLLVEEKLISKEQLELARKEVKTTGKKLSDCLLEKGFVDEAALAGFFSRTYAVDFMDLTVIEESIKLNSFELSRFLPEENAREFTMVPVMLERGKLTIAIFNPEDSFLGLDYLKNSARNFDCVVAEKSKIENVLGIVYGK